MLSQIHLSVRPSVRLSVTRVDQSKTVEVRIMQFSPYSNPIPLVVFYSISFVQKFWRDPPERGRQTRVGTAACVISNSWRFHSLEGALILRCGVCGCAYCSNYSAEWISFICEDATLFCNKWHTHQIFFCCCLVFGFCFKADFCGYIWHPFL